MWRVFRVWVVWVMWVWALVTEFMGRGLGR
jgi:hypothetical protein